MTTTFTPPPIRHRGSSFLHRHHTNNMSSSQSTLTQPKVFEGTDTIPQNQKVALQRVIEVHDALELQNSDSSSVRRHDSAELSMDCFKIEFDVIDLPNGEIRAFKYLLRLWDRSEQPDPEFDEAMEQNRRELEDAIIRHFFRRIALWNESEEALEAAKKERRKMFKWNSAQTDEKESKLSKLWQRERERQEPQHDELKEITTREGLAQLLWTLMHDASAPLAPELFAECSTAVKRMYGIKC